jgi:hypothetical protein
MHGLCGIGHAGIHCVRHVMAGGSVGASDLVNHRDYITLCMANEWFCIFRGGVASTIIRSIVMILIRSATIGVGYPGVSAQVAIERVHLAAFG